jgi:hypothetical protein
MPLHGVALSRQVAYLSARLGIPEPSNDQFGIPTVNGARTSSPEVALLRPQVRARAWTPTATPAAKQDAPAGRPDPADLVREGEFSGLSAAKAAVSVPLCTLRQEARPGPQARDRREGRGVEAEPRPQALALRRAPGRQAAPGRSFPGAAPGPGWSGPPGPRGRWSPSESAWNPHARPPTYELTPGALSALPASTQTPRPRTRGRASSRGVCVVFCAAQRAAQ